jgi:hypothetical protein
MHCCHSAAYGQTRHLQRGHMVVRLRSLSEVNSTRTITHRCPVEVSELWIVAKSIVHGRYGRTPHQYYHSEVVKLVPKGRDTWTVVGDDMKSAPIHSATPPTYS